MGGGVVASVGGVWCGGAGLIGSMGVVWWSMGVEGVS